MGNIVFEGLKERAEDPVRTRDIIHTRCFGLRSSGQDKLEKALEWEVGRLPGINLKHFLDLTQVLRKG